MWGISIHTHTHIGTTHTGIILSHKKEWNLAICDSMGGTWGYCAKWNKSDRERQIPYDFTYMWNLRNKANKTRQDSKIQRTDWWFPVGRGIGGWAEWRRGSKGTNFQL